MRGSIERGPVRCIRRPVAVLLLVWLASACTSWRPIPLYPTLDPQAPRIRVTSATGERVVLNDPALDADTLRGRRCKTIILVQSCTEAAVAVPDVVLVEARRFSGLKTGLLIGIP